MHCKSHAHKGPYSVAELGKGVGIEKAEAAIVDDFCCCWMCEQLYSNATDPTERARPPPFSTTPGIGNPPDRQPAPGGNRLSDPGQFVSNADLLVASTSTFIPESPSSRENHVDEIINAVVRQSRELAADLTPTAIASTPMRTPTSRAMSFPHSASLGTPVAVEEDYPFATVYLSPSTSVAAQPEITPVQVARAGRSSPVSFHDMDSGPLRDATNAPLVEDVSPAPHDASGSVCSFHAFLLRNAFVRYFVFLAFDSVASAH